MHPVSELCRRAASYPSRPRILRASWSIVGLLALAGTILPASAQGQEAEASGARSNLKETNNPAGARSDAAVIPACFEKLKLTGQQQDQIREIVQNYDESMAGVWKQFGDRYMQAIVMESSLLAAIEDNLTEPQRQQIREQRRKTARYEKSVAATNTQVNRATEAPDEATAQRVPVGDKELEAIGISLSDEQEAAADKVQEKYRSQLRSLNRDIQGFHTRLVSLEADKLVEIEKVLTKEQLVQLRAHRQNAPAAPKLVRNVENNPSN